MLATKQLSVRMPIEIIDRLTSKGRTTPYIIEAVREKIARDDQLEIEASLLCLADDPEANDISDFAPAQAKVIARGD